jgi:hypothetical protein
MNFRRASEFCLQVGATGCQTEMICLQTDAIWLESGEFCLQTEDERL